MGEFDGMVVLITGAGRGSGRVLSEAFAAQGASVAANDISPINLDLVVDQIRAAGGRAEAYVDDVAKKVAVQALINQVIDDLGRIDVLVNHAAVEPHFPLLDIDEWDWHRTLDVNLTGAFLLTQSVGRVMREQGGGVIVNLLPLAGRDELSDRAAYVASLTGLLGLTRQAAFELAPSNIRVHAVGPGIAAYHAADVAVPSDLIEAVLYLSGPAATHLNGQIVGI